MYGRFETLNNMDVFAFHGERYYSIPVFAVHLLHKACFINIQWANLCWGRAAEKLKTRFLFVIYLGRKTSTRVGPPWILNTMEARTKMGWFLVVGEAGPRHLESFQRVNKPLKSFDRDLPQSFKIQQKNLRKPSGLREYRVKSPSLPMTGSFAKCRNARPPEHNVGCVSGRQSSG